MNTVVLMNICNQMDLLKIVDLLNEGRKNRVARIPRQSRGMFIQRPGLGTYHQRATAFMFRHLFWPELPTFASKLDDIHGVFLGVDSFLFLEAHSVHVDSWWHPPSQDSVLALDSEFSGCRP